MAYNKTFPQRLDNPEYLKYYVNGVKTVDQLLRKTDTWNDTRSGQKMPDYKDKIRLGQSAVTPFSCDISQQVMSEPGYFLWDAAKVTYPPQTIGYDWRGHAYTQYVKPAHLAVDIAAANSTALTKILQKIQSESSHLNGSAVIAEFGDVIRQFGAPASAILDLTNRHLNRLYLESRGLKGSTSFKKLKWARIVASSYLEYAFGLAPLIGDTKKAAEALARFNTEEELHKFRTRVVGRASVEKATTYLDPARTIASCNHLYQLHTMTKTQGRVQYVVGLSAPPIAAFGSNERLLQLLGFTPSNFAAAAWEVIPWSWLLDYFTNVNEIIDGAATNTSSVKWISKTVSYRTEVYHTTKLFKAAAPANYRITRAQYFREHAGISKLVRITVTRTIPASLGVPSLVFEHPFKDLQKIANMSAVLFARRPGSSQLWLF